MDIISVYRTFSYCADDRQEHQALVERLRVLCGSEESVVVTHMFGCGPMTSLKVEIIAPLSIENIQMVLADMNLGNIIFETLKQLPAAFNKFERTYKPNPYIKDEGSWS